MTHEKLLMKLWEKRNALCDNLDVHFALDAVIKLHTGIGVANRCVSCSNGKLCETIEVIAAALYV